MILVKIGKENGIVKEMALQNDTTVNQALIACGMTHLNDNEKVHRNNGIVDLYEMLEDGDILIIKTIVTEKRYENEPTHVKWALLLWNIAHAPDLPAAERIAEKYKDILGG